ncbi:MAG: zinc-ribbon domain-containing protein [Deltaproteobacteria bacterium]|nr:zinc-ribbon domain-containing protein [Deltaproteobacteria bacterium]
MKFLCGSCRTKYQISDQKVRGKILTIRCKKCGSKIVVKESLAMQTGGVVVAPVADHGIGDSETDSEGSGSTAAASKPRPDPQSFAEEGADVERTKLELRAQPSASSSASAVLPPSTSGALAAAFEVALAAAHEDMPTNVAPVPSNEQYAGVEWYLAMDGQQTGPFAFAELIRKIQSCEAEARHYAWHDGFDGWKRIRDVPDLAAYVPQAEPKKAPEPKRPPPTDFAREPVPTDSERDAVEAHREDHLDFEPTETRARVKSDVDERRDQLDDVLNAALGIAGEGKTAKAAAASASPPRDEAVALGAPAGLGEAPSAITYRESTAAEGIGNIDDLFASIPRASDHELVARESTRLFAAAAGVNSRKSRNRVGLVLGGIGAAAVVGLVAALFLGYIQVDIPGIGNPFQHLLEKSDNGFGDEVADDGLSDEERAALSGRADEEKNGTKPKNPKKKPRPRTDRPGLPSDYVSDSDADPSKATGPRGDSETTVAIGGLGSQGQVDHAPIEAQLPNAELTLPPVDGERLSAGAIKSVVAAGAKAVELCHQKESRGGDLRGKLELAVTVQPSGSVSKAEVKTAKWRGSPLGECVVGKIREWKFPQFAGEAQEIVIPFVFE